MVNKEDVTMVFSTEIKEISELFIKMRYYYENKFVYGGTTYLYNYGFLISIKEALCKYVAKIL